MKERIKELAEQAKEYADTKYSKLVSASRWGDCVPSIRELYSKKFAELIIKECAKELREAEQEAERAYKAKEAKERNTFNGYDFAEMLEERFGIE